MVWVGLYGNGSLVEVTRVAFSVSAWGVSHLVHRPAKTAGPTEVFGRPLRAELCHLHRVQRLGVKDQAVHIPPAHTEHF